MQHKPIMLHSWHCLATPGQKHLAGSGEWEQVDKLLIYINQHPLNIGLMKQKQKKKAFVSPSPLDKC